VVDPTLFWPYFQGEFDRDGNLKDPNDPYLYWLIPIQRVATIPASQAGITRLDEGRVETPREEIRDYVAVHASLRR
jgi:hypothetical protein